MQILILDNDKGSAVKLACFKTEDKYSEIIKQIEAEWKSRETSLTREIFHLSGEREEINNQLAVLKQSDLEKAAIIKGINFEHERAVREMIDSSKQDQSKEYTKFKSLEKYAQDKESEVKRLEGKVDLLKVDKEILEKQLQTLKRLHSSPDSSPTVPRIMRYTEREREQNKKIRDLEEKLKQANRNRGGSTMSNYSFDTSTSPGPDSQSTVSPNLSISPDTFDRTAVRRENRELREQVKQMEERYISLQRNPDSAKHFVSKEIEGEFLQRELELKEKYHKEIEVLENESRGLRHKIRELSSLTDTELRIEDMQTVVDSHEQRYRQLYKDSIMNQQVYSMWCDTNGKTADFEALRAQYQSLQIQCDSLKSEYTSVQLQNTELIEEREEAVADKIDLETKFSILQETMDANAIRIEELENNEIESSKLRETNEILKNEQEGFTHLIDKQIQKIDFLKSYEAEIYEIKTFQENCQSLQEKLIQDQSKEKELMAIIQTLEDQNSYLQSEVQSKDDKLSDMTSIISNLTERLKKQKSHTTETNGTGRNINHTGSEILFYPQMAQVNKNNTNNNNNNDNNADDEMEFEAIEDSNRTPIKLLSEQNIFRELEETEEAYNSETAPLSLSTDSDTTNSQEELPQIDTSQEADSHTQDIAITDQNTDDVSVDEWSHASEEKIGQTTESPNVSPIPTPDSTPMKRTPDLFLVRYNYDPLVSSPNPHPEQELPLRAGDCIYIYGTPDEDGFYLGELTGGKSGLVPSNFVEKIKLGFSAGADLIDDNVIAQTASNQGLEEMEKMGPLDLYIQAQSTDPLSLVLPYISNLSNIVEEDESLLDESNLTRISGNISSTESINKSKTENNSSNESLDKITDIQTPIPSPQHIPETRDIRVKYTDSDVILTWSVPQQTYDTIQGYNVSIGTGITHFIEGSVNTSFSLSTLQDMLAPGKYTLVVCTVTNHGYSDPTECTVDTTLVPAPNNININREDSYAFISWDSPDTNSLTSPLVSFNVYLNEIELVSVDFSEFLVNRGVYIPRTDLLKFYESTPDQHMGISVRSVLSDGRYSPLSEALVIPLLLLTHTDSISGGMTVVDTESSEECSRHSTSSESELLEVFRKSSLETDQLIKAKRNISLEFSEVTNKPPIAHRAALAQSIGSNQRQSFTPNEDDLFSELEAQGEANLSPEMFSVPQSQSSSDNEDAAHYEFQLETTVIYYVALYDYNPKDQSPNEGDDKSELPLRKGEVLAIFGETDEDGFFTGQADNQVGLIPYNLVEKIKLCEVSGEASSALLFQATKQAFPARNFKALYSYNPSTDSPNCEDLDDELSFQSGTSISIYGDVQDDGFYIGELDGEIGYVPSNFIESMEHIKPQDSHVDQQITEGTIVSKGASPGESHKPNKNILAKTKGILRSLSKKS